MNLSVLCYTGYQIGGQLMFDKVLDEISKLDVKELFDELGKEEDVIVQELIKHIISYRGQLRQREIINREEFIR